MTRTQLHASPDDIDITALWGAVARNKLRLAIFVLTVGIVTFLALSFMTPRYVSTAQILIEQRERPLTRPRTSSPGQTDPTRVDKEAVKSQVQVIRSGDLARKVAQDLGLAKKAEFNPALKKSGIASKILTVAGFAEDYRNMTEEERVLTAFRKRLMVSEIKDSRVIRVEFSSSNPRLAATVANKLSEAYIAWQRGEKVKLNSGASKRLGAELAKLRKEAEEADAKARSFRARAGLVTGNARTTLNAQQLSELNSQLSLARAARSEAEARAKQIRAMLASGSINSAPDVIKSPLIQRLLEQRVRVQRQLSELSATLLPAHPRMRQLRSELAGLKRQIRSEALTIVAGLEGEAKIAGARERALVASLDKLKAKAGAGTMDEAKLKALESEAKSKRELLEAYLARYGDARVRSGGRFVPAFASIIQRALPSSLPAFPKKMPITMLAMVAALLLGLVWIVTRELLAGARRGPAAGAYGGVAMAGDTPPPAGPSHAQAPQVLISTGAANGIALQAPGSRPVDRDTAGGATAKSPNVDRIDPVDRVDPVVPVAPPAAPSPTPASIAQAELLAQTNGMRQGDAFRIVDRVGEIIAHLVARGHEGQGLRTIITGASQEVDATCEALEVARSLAAGDQTVVLVDWSEHAPLATLQLGIDDAPGLRELALGEADFDSVIQIDPESELQIIAAGQQHEVCEDAGYLAKLNMIFDALDGAYDQIIVLADRNAARGLFKFIEGRFDVGCSVGAHGSGEEAASQPFLGVATPDFDVVHLERGEPAPNSQTVETHELRRTAAVY